MRAVAVALAALLIVGCGETVEPPPASLPADVRPNVIWIVLDAARTQNFSWYGYSRETTPYIDRLTREGAAFHRHYAQAPATLYSISSYLSGRYFATSYHDDVGMQSAFRVRPDGERLFSEIARANGYRAVAYSTSPWFFEGSKLAGTFDAFTVCRDANGGMEPLDAIVNRVEDWLASPGDEPFLLYLHALDTHFPHTVNGDVRGWYPDGLSGERQAELASGQAKPPYSEDDRAYLEALYDGGLREADTAVARLCEMLRESGVLDQSYLVISSDHGELLGEDGQTAYHPIQETRTELLHTPLILRGPGIVAGTEVRAITENVDIVPTLVDLLDWRTDAEVEGVSLRPHWTGDTTAAGKPYAAARSLCFASLGKPAMVLIDEGYRYVFRWCDEKTSAYSLAPGEAGPPRDRIETAAAYAESAFRLRWDAFEALPQEAPPVQQRPFPDEASPADAYVQELDDTDGKWTLVDGALREGGAGEDVPPIRVGIPVRAGEYFVTIEGEPSAGDVRVRMKTTADESYRELRAQPLGEFAFGRLRVDGLDIVLEIDDVPESAPVVLRAVRFERVDEQGAIPGTTESLSERLEMLRQMGYVD
jgi:arylsulfatase A-like enzyme